MKFDSSSMIDSILAPLNDSGTSGKHGIRFVGESCDERYASYSDIAQMALDYCAALSQLGVRENDLVMLAHPASIEHVGLLMGCILCGALPCTVPTLGKRMIAVNSVVELACRLYRPRVLFTTDACAQQAQEMMAGLGVRVVDSNCLRLAVMAGGVAEISRKSLAAPHHVQLTSGSVSYPKAAILSHQNVIDNCRGIAGALRYSAENGDGSVAWLPMYHDMGLITLFTNYLYKTPLLLMQPAGFMRNPLGWLKRIADTGATTTSAPTFALRYCIRRFSAEAMEGADLSRCRKVVIGAERVDQRTLQEFAQTFAPYGLCGAALLPCYGMAESTLAVTMPHLPVRRPNSPAPLSYAVPDYIDTVALNERQVAVVAGTEKPSRSECMLSMGTPIKGMQYVIRNAQGKTVAERHAGEIFIRGTSVMLGYLPSAKMTAPAAFDDAGWLATGDIGYVADGLLFILGRKKEIIIVRGSNYFPHEFEEAVADHPSVFRGACVAVGVFDETQGTEKLVMFIEAESTIAVHTVRVELQMLLLLHQGIAAHEIVFVAPNELPRTTSGKLQRSLCRRMYLDGALGNATAIFETAPTAGNASDMCRPHAVTGTGTPILAIF